MFEEIKKFLLEYDLPKIQEALRKLDWGKILTSGEFWLVTIPVVVVLVWRRQFQMMLLLGSLLAFTFMLPHMMPGGDEVIPLPRLVMFLGGTLVLILINLYFVFVRKD
jgi:hypothetical protein